MPVWLPSAPLRGCFLQTGPYLALIGLALLWGPQLCQATAALLRLWFQLWLLWPLVFSPGLSIPSAPCPVAFSVPSFTCLASRDPTDDPQFFSISIPAPSGFSQRKTNVKHVNMYGPRIRAFVHIDGSAKQLVPPNITMIYHYHIFVGKSIKSIVSASEAGLVLLTRWESVKVPEYGSQLWLRSMAFVDTKLNNKPSKSRLEEERNRCEKQIRQWEKLISCARLTEHELWSCWRAAKEQTPSSETIQM